jgi:hypothetical protein
MQRQPVISFFALADGTTRLARLPALLGSRNDLNQRRSWIAQLGPALVALIVARRSRASRRAWAAADMLVPAPCEPFRREASVRDREVVVG